MTSKKYIIDTLIIFLAVAPAFVSYFLDISKPSEMHWFARSGSIMVFFAVILEFRQEHFAAPRRSTGYMEKGVGLLVPVELSRFRKNLRITALMLAILGTAIWGYGDLVFKI